MRTGSAAATDAQQSDHITDIEFARRAGKCHTSKRRHGCIHVALSLACLRPLLAAVLWLRWQDLDAVSGVVSTWQSCALVCVGGGSVSLCSSSHSVTLVVAGPPCHGANLVNLMQGLACLQHKTFHFCDTEQIATLPILFHRLRAAGAPLKIQYLGVHCQTCSPS